MDWPRRRSDATTSANIHALLAQKAGDRIAESAAADLARAFRGTYAPVRRLIALSRSAEELEASLRTFYDDHSEARIAPIIEDALTAYAANGTLIAKTS